MRGRQEAAEGGLQACAGVSLASNGDVSPAQLYVAFVEDD